MEVAVAAALVALQRACEDLGMGTEVALAEKLEELQIRSFIRCIPNERLKPRQYAGFVESVLGRQPTAEILEAIAESERRLQRDEESVTAIEVRQNYRCALCGMVLTREAGPELDHVVPIKLRGKDDLSNLELLCRRCNRGKSKLLSWIMGAPFFDFPEPSSKLTMKMRYCVLAQRRQLFGGYCNGGSCEETPATARMEVTPVVPIQRGGRMIFDNLTVLCELHASEVAKSLRATPRLRIRSPRLHLSAPS